MKPLLSTIVLLVALVTSAFTPPAFAEIRELKSMRDLQITPGALVVFDLDNTVMETRQMLGSDQFFGYLVKKFRAAGADEKTAIEMAIKENATIQPKSKVRAVESVTPSLIRKLQARGHKVIALTARPVDWSMDTLAQLRSVGVTFARSAPRGPGLKQGVIFLPNGRDKGSVLAEFIQVGGLQPQHVVFIDDKAYHVESVEHALAGMNLGNLNLRYGGADERVRAFDPAVVEVQLAYYRKHGVFLTDEEARSKNYFAFISIFKPAVPTVTGFPSPLSGPVLSSASPLGE